MSHDPRLAGAGGDRRPSERQRATSQAPGALTPHTEVKAPDTPERPNPPPPTAPPATLPSRSSRRRSTTAAGIATGQARAGRRQRIAPRPPERLPRPAERQPRPAERQPRPAERLRDRPNASRDRPNASRDRPNASRDRPKASRDRAPMSRAPTDRRSRRAAARRRSVYRHEPIIEGRRSLLPVPAVPSSSTEG